MDDAPLNLDLHDPVLRPQLQGQQHAGGRPQRLSQLPLRLRRAADRIPSVVVVHPDDALRSTQEIV